MTHPSPEALALLVSDELSLAEATRMEAHLVLCPDCQAVVSDFRRQAEAVRASTSALPVPAMAVPVVAPARWAWLPLTAAVAALVVILMGGTVPQLASALTRLFSFVQLEQLNPEETANHASKLNEQEGGGKCEAYRDAAEAEAVWGRRSMQPRYLPQGFSARRYTACLVWFSTEYRNANGHWFSITQGPTGGRMKVPEGASTVVTVNGEPALLLRGNWVGTNVAPKKIEYRWDPEAGVTLLFERDGQTFSIFRISTRIEVDEMIRIAESIR